MADKVIDYLSTILLGGIIAMRNDVDDDKAKELTNNLLTNADWHALVEYMEDAIEQSQVDYELVEQQLVHFLKTDQYWVAWSKRVVQ